MNFFNTVAIVAYFIICNKFDENTPIYWLSIGLFIITIVLFRHICHIEIIKKIEDENLTK